MNLNKGNSAEDYVIECWIGRGRGIQSHLQIGNVRKIGNCFNEFTKSRKAKLCKSVYKEFGVVSECGGAAEIVLKLCQEEFHCLPSEYFVTTRRASMYNFIRQCAAFQRGKYVYPPLDSEKPVRGRKRKASSPVTELVPQQSETPLLLPPPEEEEEQQQPSSSLLLPSDKPKMLVLGMVLSEELQNDATQQLRGDGQLLRDGIRLRELQKNFEVFTFDDKHWKSKFPTVIESLHCVGNYAQAYGSSARYARTFQPCVKALWPGITFDYIIVDYFFMPPGYSADRQGRWLPRDSKVSTVESIGIEKLLNVDGKIIMANMRDLSIPMEAYSDRIGKYFNVLKLPEERINENPLWKATMDVNSELLSHNQQKYANANQRPGLDQYFPFFVLTVTVEYACK